ncbi:MAG: alpha/beta fold hydrolase [Rhodomicrobium sp.]
MKPALPIAAFLMLMTAGCASAPAETPPVNDLLPAKFLTRPEGRIAYDDTGGTGPLVIAIPGMGDLRGEYRYLRPLLARAGYRVVTFDVRGHGQSSVRWSDYSAHAVGQDALALIDELGAGPAAVIGTSFAAGSALWAAHDAPDKIRGIVMIGPILRDYPAPIYMKAAAAIGFAGPWRVSFWTWYWDSLFTMHKPADHEAYRAALAANLHELGRMDALRAMVELSKADTEAILGRVQKPALIIMGTRDKDFGDAAAEAKSLALRAGAKLTLVEGAGHYPQVEAPETAGPRIAEFIGTLP